MISQQNSLLERLLPSGKDKIEQVHIRSTGHNLNPLLVNPSFDSGAFAHFSGSRDVTEASRLRPIVNLSTERSEMGSVERELRHVRFESDDTAFRPGIQDMDSRLRHDDNHSQEINVNNSDSRRQNTVPRLIRIVVGEPNAHGEIIDREIYVTEQRYREMTYDERPCSRDILDNRRIVSRASVRSNESRG